MAFISRWKVLALFTLLILTFLCIISAMLLVMSYERREHFQKVSQSSYLPTVTSSCPTASVMNSRHVKMYSNRISNEQYYTTIGMSTVLRGGSSDEYLIKTLNSLVAEKKDNSVKLLIVLLLADRDTATKHKIARKIQKLFSKLIVNGVLDIIQVPTNFYPEKKTLKRRFGDSVERVRWRSKQVLDYSFLLCYCYGLAEYHLQLEDDVVTVPHYLLKLQDFIQRQSNTTWFTLDAAFLGYIGKVYHNNHLGELASYLFLFFDEMPVDWLEYSWRDLKGQVPRFKPRVASLFQHIGVKSSLKNKTQERTERFMDKFSQKFLGLNPPAFLVTDLQAKYGTAPTDAYNKGGGYFWGTCFKPEGCYFEIVFERLVEIREIFIGSAGNLAPADKVINGTLIIGKDQADKSCLNYDKSIVETFREGEIHKTFSHGLHVNCLKILIEKQTQWVLIRTIDIWKV